ncbi:polyhydroxyalkanoate synthesis regulator DNA-binding domain-containing protein [Caldilinea sp.]|jgi:polyhydroxyalkanoate synthesis repressor PhaR|uniref:polyhydroxyalkanoate synthesis regulator DNA-binding domain-containing protein n=1 Tax=Caldilinea sp. TaxID=2293560 RepID=UPI0021DE2047|nr:polyhydroxyalkanoate synthesis regulator DNA-binding domain-containing protein [Caldilinea sp.]GIV67477.1 MAG: pesticidal protein Cry15Aa [Caldilinea sp.]
MPVIKRYPNRKLYDTEAKRYVTLDQIAEMIQARKDVLVIDHETGEDLTNLTLSQIIFEQEKKGAGFLQRSLLANLIRAGGDTLDQMRRALTAPLHLDSGEKRDSGEKKEGANQGALDALLFHRIDELMQDILTTLNVPTARDLRKLQAQLDELNEKISALLAAEEGNKPGDESTSVAEASEQISSDAEHETQ